MPSLAIEQSGALAIDPIDLIDLIYPSIGDRSGNHEYRE